jgi:hypothetical protein
MYCRACAGLDNAILGYLNADERKVDGARIAQLLAHGAHALGAPDEEAAKEGEAFAKEVSPGQLVCGASWHVQPNCKALLILGAMEGPSLVSLEASLTVESAGDCC